MLAVVVLLGLPLYALSVLFGKVPRGRSAWRFALSVAMLSLIVLGTGWFTARSLTWWFYWKYGEACILDRGAGSTTHSRIWQSQPPSQPSACS